jgi:hypothetical protein
MKPIKRVLLLAIVLVILMVCAIQTVTPSRLPAKAEGELTPTPTSEPERTTTIKVAFTMYEWWLSYWRNNQVACQVYVEHEGVPIPAEVNYFCGQDVLNQWMATPACDLNKVGSTTQCAGLYLHLRYTTAGEREIKVQLAPPKVWVSIEGCSNVVPYNRCEKLPNLVFTGEEPLPNETIVRIQGTIGGESFTCPGGQCSVPLPPTGLQGIPVEFWADSSYGDASQHFTAQVRVMPWGDFMAPEGKSNDKPLWYTDVISSQWRGAPLASCSQIWSSFPDVGGPPPWLSTPDQVAELHSYNSYYYLAAQLIKQGAVDASDCPDGGLQSPTFANACGVERARPQAIEWQNAFDSEILRVAKDSGVPGQLLKNVFGRESQLWPGMYATYKEAGLGQLTDGGADTVLLWNASFFSQLCPLVFQTTTCQKGFGNLTDDQKAILRGAVVQKVNAACPNCPTGIDLSQANFSISVFARSMLANCEQVSQIIYDTTQKMAGEVSNYTDLWRFTLANYNAGSGCLSRAIQNAYDDKQPLDWTTVTSYLEPACQSTIKYVEDVSSMPDLPGPTPTPIIPLILTQTPGGPLITATPRVSITPRGPTSTPLPTITPGGPTVTQEPYPYPYPPGGTEAPTEVYAAP